MIRYLPSVVTLPSYTSQGCSSPQHPRDGFLFANSCSWKCHSSSRGTAHGKPAAWLRESWLIKKVAVICHAHLLLGHCEFGVLVQPLSQEQARMNQRAPGCEPMRCKGCSHALTMSLHWTFPRINPPQGRQSVVSSAPTSRVISEGTWQPVCATETPF